MIGVPRLIRIEQVDGLQSHISEVKLPILRVIHDNGVKLVPLVFFEPGPPLALDYVLTDHLDLWAVLLRLLYHSPINNFMI